MAVSTQLILGPILKIQRAERHIDELRLTTYPLHRNLSEIVVVHSDVGGPDEHPECYRLVYRPKHPIPEFLAVIIGDAIHNLRSALDLLAGGIIRTLPGKPLGDKRPHFPMHSERKNLEADLSLAAIEKALPGAKKLLLEDIRPANGPNETTWRFNVLNNLDKHNLIIPAVSIAEIKNVNARWGTGGVMYGGIDRGDAARPRVMMETGEPITIGDDFQ